MRAAAIVPVAVICALIVACGSEPSGPGASSAAKGRKVDAATAGDISGTVRFTGTPPPIETVRVSSDRNCVQDAGPNPQSDAVLIGADGSLRNSFVYIKDGLDADYVFDTPTSPAVLDQQGCFYTPRVLGVQVGQPIDVVNSDPTLHNVHSLPMLNTEFNYPQPTKGMRTREVFTVPEVMVRFMCNVHNWMAAYVGVLPHPFFAVTDERGQFSIRGLPPGNYTLEAWHEKFGRQTSTVTIAERATQTAAFEFAAASAK